MEITKTTDGNAVMLSVGGALDALTAPAFAEAVGEVSEIADLVLDLQSLEYVSSMGLREIVRAQKKMSGKGSFTIVRVPAEIADVFRMTGLYERLNILS